MTGTPPPQSIDIRVWYAETDRMGVVYHANYFMWFEIGRCELLRRFGRSYRDVEDSGLFLPVIEAHCEYKSPARYDDELQVWTQGKLVSRTRVEFMYEIKRPADNTLNAIGRTLHAALDASGRPCRLPDYIREALE